MVDKIHLRDLYVDFQGKERKGKERKRKGKENKGKERKVSKLIRALRQSNIHYFLNGGCSTP